MGTQKVTKETRKRVLNALLRKMSNQAKALKWRRFLRVKTASNDEPTHGIPLNNTKLAKELAGTDTLELTRRQWDEMRVGELHRDHYIGVQRWVETHYYEPEESQGRRRIFTRAEIYNSGPQGLELATTLTTGVARRWRSPAGGR